MNHLHDPRVIWGASKGILALAGLNKSMQITLLSTTRIPSMTKGKQPKPYDMLDMAFKNHTFGDKIEGKKLTPFGANEKAYKALAQASPGDRFEITVVKNDAGFNDWTDAVLGGSASTGAVAASAPAPTGYAPRAAAPTTPAGNSRGFPTPEERAKTNVSIVRQSSMSTAAKALAAGAKAPVKYEELEAYAAKIEAWVHGTPIIEPDFGKEVGEDDIPF